MPASNLRDWQADLDVKLGLGRVGQLDALLKIALLASVTLVSLEDRSGWDWLSPVRRIDTYHSSVKDAHPPPAVKNKYLFIQQYGVYYSTVGGP